MIKIVRCRWKVDFRSYFHPLMFSNPILVLEKEAVVTRLPSYAKERELRVNHPRTCCVTLFVVEILRMNEK